MNRSFSVPQKLKAAAYLLALVLTIMLTSASMQQAMQGVDRTLTSVYADRLQPAVYLVYISEHLHAKRLLLEEKLWQTAYWSPSELKGQLHHHDIGIGNQVAQFEKTSLTDSERRWLQHFRKTWTASKEMEQSVLQLIESKQQEKAIALSRERGVTLFNQGVKSLHALAQIQAQTEQKAVSSAHQMAAGVSLEATFLQAVSVVIALLTLGLIHNMKGPERSVPPLHLN